MPLQKQQVDVPIVGGLEEGTDTRLVTKLARAENIVYRKRGGIQKRYGTVKGFLYTSNDYCTDSSMVARQPGTPEHCFAFNSQLVRIGSDARLHTYNSTLPSANDWIRRNLTTTANITRYGLRNSTKAVDDLDVAYGGGLIGLSWASSNVIYFEMRDATTLEVLVPATVVATGGTKDSARIIYGASQYFVISYRSAANTLSVIRFDTQAHSFSAATNLTTAMGANNYDICSLGASSDSFVAVWKRNAASGGNWYEVQRSSVSAFASQSTVTWDAGANTAFSIGVYMENIARVWVIAAECSFVTGNYTTIVKYSLLNATSATATVTSGPTTIQTIGPETPPPFLYGCSIIEHSATLAMWTFGIKRAASTTFVSGAYWGTVTNAGVVNTIYTSLGTHFMSRIAKRSNGTDTEYYVLGTNAQSFFLTTATYGTAYWLRLLTAATDTGMNVPSTQAPLVNAVMNYQGLSNLSGTSFYGRKCSSVTQTVSGGVLITGSANNLVSIAQVSASNWYTLFSNEVDSTTTYAFKDPIQLCNITFNDATQTTAVLSDTAVTSGSAPMAFTRNLQQRYAFPYSPTIALTATTGGSMTTSVSYNYTAVYSFMDDMGNIVRSDTAAPVTVAMSTNTAVIVKVTPVGLADYDDLSSNAINRVQIEIYRTAAGGAAPYYKVNTIDNALSASTLSITDTLGDTTIVAYPQVYTTGEVDNVPPPPARVSIAHQGRFWLGGTDDDTIWYTKQKSVGKRPGFSEALTIPPFEGGRVKALGSLDDKLIIFKDTSIWVVAGEGNGDSGVGGTLGVPQRISSDTGCTEPRSVVITPLGLMFRGQRCIMLLDRGLQLHPLGLDVETTLTSTYDISSAVVVGDQSQVRFSMNNASSTSDTGAWVLVYDWNSQAWTKFLYYCTAEAGFRAAKCATMLGANYTFLTPVGQIYNESKSAYKDDTQFISMAIKTAKLKLAGLQGMFRLWRAWLLGTYNSAHDITIKLYTDETASPQSKTFAAANLNVTPEQMQITPVIQRAQSMEIEVIDADASGDGRSIDISGIHLEFGLYQQATRRVASARKG